MASETARELFVVGLRNAHAMENQAHELMERQSERTGDYPETQRRLRDHLRETKEQLTRLEGILERLGESTSTIKDTVLSFGANLAAMGHAMASDEILKNALANNAFEHYEIAAYKSLLALCEKANVPDAAPLLKASLQEEEKMAAWVDSNVEKTTLQYLAHEERARAA